MRTIYETDEHVALREQVARFVDNEVRPHGAAWEDTGMVPRAVLRQMGALGFFGIRYPEAYGGSEQGQIASAILAEECGLSGFGGFSATVLVHTDRKSTRLNSSH